jgi:nucleotide-binding universal stress UspA family protein
MIRHGKADQIIVEVAGPKSAGLIVTGNHRSTGLTSLIMGS